MKRSIGKFPPVKNPRRFDYCTCGHPRYWHNERRPEQPCDHHCGPGTECRCTRFRLK
jgi:hypothetical protein